MDFDLKCSVAVLERTPAVLRSLLAGLSGDWLYGNEGAETWSPFDVLGHLIDGEDMDWMVRARIILARDDQRPFEPFDRFRHLQANRGRTLEELLNHFCTKREENLLELKAWDLKKEQLKLPGEHPEFGTVTLAQLLATWVAHDLGHLAQIARVMARQYRQAAGPWVAYLPVLQD